MNNEEKILAMLPEMKATLEEMKTTLTRVAVTQENVVLPRIQALYENHGTIMEKLDTLASKERVDEHESDISIMKDAITLLRMDVNELKRAQ